MNDDTIIKVCTATQRAPGVGDLALSLMEGLGARISRIVWRSR